MASTIKISPVPRNITEEQVKNELGAPEVSRVIIVGDIAYVVLSSPSSLEKLAGKYGDDLRIPTWASTIEPLESTFNVDNLAPEILTYTEKAANAASEALKRGENLLGGVVEGVKDMIGSGISKEIGPTVNFKEYSEKVKKIVNVLLAIWLICLLN